MSLLPNMHKATQADVGLTAELTAPATCGLIRVLFIKFTGFINWLQGLAPLALLPQYNVDLLGHDRCQ